MTDLPDSQPEVALPAIEKEVRVLIDSLAESVSDEPPPRSRCHDTPRGTGGGIERVSRYFPADAVF